MGPAEMKVMRRNHDQVRSGVYKILARHFRAAHNKGLVTLKVATRCFKVEICCVIAAESG